MRRLIFAYLRIRRLMGVHLPLFLLFFIALPALASAHDVLVVQSERVRAYEEVVRGFRSSCDGRVDQLVLAELGNVDLAGAVRARGPKVILAIGAEALGRLQGIRDIPVIAVMLLQLPGEGERGNITGISMQLPPEKQFALIRQVLPGVRRVGLVYNPARSGAFARKARQAAESAGIRLVTAEISRAQELAAKLAELKGEIDAFLMVPDPTVVTPQTVELLSIFSLEQRVPLVAFSEIYLESGALVSLNIDPKDMGKQAGEMANRLLDGFGTKDVPPASARRVTLSINHRVARQLGVPVNYRAEGKTTIRK